MRIHMLGIGGTGMCSLAGLLTSAGHRVTGTDEALYPPMSEQVAALGIRPFKGYRPDNVDAAEPQLAIIGNVIRKDNPEAQEILRRGIPYRSMPAALAEFFLSARTPIVVAGTHGKTTCSTMAAWLLEAAGESPGFLIGGVGANLGRSFAVGHGHLFVVEGDEYDTAFFDKGPKFLHYRPQAAMITSIEFDHADIYRDIDHVYSSFERLAGIVPPDGLIAANASDPLVMRAAAASKARTVTYGLSPDAQYRPHGVSVSEAGTAFRLSGLGSEFLLPMWGAYNLENAAGVLAVLLESGVDERKLADGLREFRGVKRRQEFIAEAGGIALVDDFAHHPTAVARTIDGVRERYPSRRIWAIFEPRTNTSRRNVFQKDFALSLSKADRVIIASPYREDAIPQGERFESRSVADSLSRGGTDAHHIPEVDDIVKFVERESAPGDVLLVMSNGGFGGLVKKLADSIGKRRNA